MIDIENFYNVINMLENNDVVNVIRNKNTLFIFS